MARLTPELAPSTAPAPRRAVTLPSGTGTIPASPTGAPASPAPRPGFELGAISVLPPTPGSDRSAGDGLASLSNQELLLQLAQASGPTGADGSTLARAPGGRQALLLAERGRRVALGHKWLEAGPTATLSGFYRLTPGPNGSLAVVSIDPRSVLGGAASLRGDVVLTPQQLQEVLRTERIGTSRSANAAASGVAGGRLFIPVQDVHGLAAASAFQYPVGNDRTGRFQLLDARNQAPPGEVALPGSAPVSRGGAVPRTLALDHGTNVPERLIQGGRGRINASYSSGTGDDFSRGFYLSEDPSVAVSAAHVRAQRGGGTPSILRFIAPSGAIGPELADLRPGTPLYEAFQRFLAQPKPADVPNSNIVLPPELARQVPSLGDYITSGSGVERRGVYFEQFLRSQGLLGADSIVGPIGDTGTSGAVRSAFTESTQTAVRSQRAADRLNAIIDLASATHSTAAELNTAARLGPVRASGRAGAQGGLAGGLIAVAFEGGTILLDAQSHPNAAAELGQAAALGAGGGAVAGTVEQNVFSRLARSGLGRPLQAILYRGAGGGAGGGAAAVGIEAVRIFALERRPHSAGEVALRLGREGIIGGASGAIGTIAGAALTGALVGSGLPVAGTVAGFVVGFIVGVGSAYLLNRIVPTVDPR